jgi:hypothetical protein
MLVERWRAIAARILGLTEAANLLAQFMQVHSGEPYKVHQSLGSDCNNVLTDIEAFGDEFRSTLPAAVIHRIDTFAAARGELFRGAKDDIQIARAALVLLSAIGPEITYLLNDQQEMIRTRAERAFLHLQRLIVADRGARELWQTARSHHETACEKLGATHLLWHGIFGFKVDGVSGGRTDLVMPGRIDLEQAARAAEGLILTEWKTVGPNDFDRKYEDARNQAERYGGGVLGGLELATHRYLVGVSTKALPAVPPDTALGAVLYRHINIAVDPEVPSAEARRR